MLGMHCHRCGGFIGNPAGRTYREASRAAPHSRLWMGGDAVVHGRSPELAHELRGVQRRRLAPRTSW
jgi:hypothetical protein